jgi:adenine-specific DNA-methyltransferase
MTKDYAPQNFKYPTTRYSGSKRKFVGWIWENVKDIPFRSVLDVFGGSGSVGLLFKRYGKQVFYNDLMKFNQIIGTAVIENDSVTVTPEEVDAVLQFKSNNYHDFIRKEFAGIYFLDEENAWLDKVIKNIGEVEDRLKRAILLSSLFQACLAKRPFNLFHRANLNIRVATVERTFGNKTTWERPFSELLKRYVAEYNNAVFDNGQDNRVIGGYDSLAAPNGVDLVYIDPPYFSQTASHGTNYMTFYHFLEGLSEYEGWSEKIKSSTGKTKRISDTEEISRFVRKSQIPSSFEKLLRRYKDNLVVLSYQSNGIPSKDEIISMFQTLGKKVTVHTKAHRYVLSSKSGEELLFIAQ